MTDRRIALEAGELTFVPVDLKTKVMNTTQWRAARQLQDSR